MAAIDTHILAGIVAQYDTVDDVVRAARKVRDAGFTRWDVYSPFPIHGIDFVIGRAPTILPWLVLLGGLIGVATGYLIQWWTMAVDYPFVISGKPYNSLPAFIPAIFESAILCAALAAVIGMLGLNRLPMLYNPLFKLERFRRVTMDRFFIFIETSDPKFDEQSVTALIASTNPAAVEKVED